MTTTRRNALPGADLCRHVRLSAAALALAAAFGPAWGQAAAAAAEVVLVVGKGERRETAETVWVDAQINSKIRPGGFVRTLANSQMGLLMSDRTQVRLNQNSQLQIKSMAEATQWSESTVRLNAGRAWSQARPQTAPASSAKAPRLTMETPTATIGIRGTDWEVEVDPDGRTRLVVLSGSVDMSNEHGAITVASGEAAVAEAGKAPVRLLLVNPRSRVQWVSSWKPQPRRWAGTDAQRLDAVVRTIEAGDYTQATATLRASAPGDAAAARLLADLLLYQGDDAAAQQVLSPHAQGGRGDALAIAMLAQTLARQDQSDEAQRLVDAALASQPKSVELLIAAGDLAILQGDAQRAGAAYAAALEVQPRNVDAWYGLGLIASERERIAQARAALGQALQLAPDDGRARAELAAAETFAGNLAVGRQLLQEVLLREPANYQALTALGINRLKSGQTTEALDDFLKAGLIEPRYARAWLYSGVAFYQLGERARAMQAFEHAAQLDARDPMAHLFRGLVEGDALDPGAAIASAREAQRRMPFLRSLNQVASNQKGSANQGSALAGFGMEEWAGFYASEAYSPYWGGSHLFLADRYTGKFNRNSELFKGYLTEPTAFGASNRQSSLVAAPGRYGRLELLAERTDWRQLAAIGTINGLSVDPVPLAYHFSGDLATAQSRDDPSTGRSRNFTLGLGAKPNYQLGLFAFATDTQLLGKLRTSSLPSDSLDQRERRADLGLNFKLQPDNQIWLKGGSGRQDNQVAGAMISPSLAGSLNRSFNTTIFGPNGALDFGSSIAQRDLQLRHAFTAGAVQWSWGVERSTQQQDGHLATTFTPAQFDVGQQFSVRATDAWLSARMQPGQSFDAQLDVFGQRSSIQRYDTSALALQVTPPRHFTLEDNPQQNRFDELNPRAGFKWQIAPQRTVRAALQKWRRPASAGTLAPVDTVGLALNDRLVSAGGLYERARVQFDGEFGSATFVRAFADRERVVNGLAGRRTAISDFEVTQLESLRSRPDVFSARSDLEETPQFAQGRMNTVGLAVNHLVSRNHAIAARALHRQADQTGANAGLRIPFIPRDMLQLDSQWSVGGQWLLGASATWRGKRFRDEANLDPLSAGWAFAFTAYWESQDRRSSVQALMGNLLPNKDAGHERAPQLSLRYAYRF